MTEPRLTTASGIPVADNQNSLSAGARGPLLLQDFHLIEKLQHFNRERIPERVVHAKGSGAYGTFTVTHDIGKYTKAKLFSAVGRQTETFVRFYENVNAAGTGSSGFGHGDGGWALTGLAGRYDGRGQEDDYSQAGNLFRLLPPQEQQNLFDNMAGPLSQTSTAIQTRMLGHIEKADPAYAAGVRAAIGARNAR